jgi:hypothetical protein
VESARQTHARLVLGKCPVLHDAPSGERTASRRLNNQLPKAFSSVIGMNGDANVGDSTGPRVVSCGSDQVFTFE